MHRSDPGFLALRVAVCLAALALLSACAGNGPAVSARGQAARYAAGAHGDYAPPGPPGDPWGPYIRAAASRFDVPTAWIRAVMHVESGGQEYLNGQLTTSPAGAMGLMQVMPDTYRDMAAQYQLGGDPYNPRNNILAGTAYLRLMYDIYGSPGFLAAYNAGPRRLDDYLADQRPLPNETRRYVAMIAPHIAGTYPHHLSPATAYAMNVLPSEIPPGLRYNAAYRPAGRQAPLPQPVPFRPAPVQMAMAPPPPQPEPQRAQIAYNTPARAAANWRPLRPPRLCGNRAGAAVLLVGRRLGGAGGRVRDPEPGASRRWSGPGARSGAAWARTSGGHRCATWPRGAVAGAADRAVAGGCGARLPDAATGSRSVHGAVTRGAVLATGGYRRPDAAAILGSIAGSKYCRRNVLIA